MTGKQRWLCALHGLGFALSVLIGRDLGDALAVHARDCRKIAEGKS